MTGGWNAGNALSYLKRASHGSTEPVTEIVFVGERFDVMSVRRWRDEALRRRVV